jgi:hypothetical protein
MAQGLRGPDPTTLFLLCLIKTPVHLYFPLRSLECQVYALTFPFNFTVYLVLWFQSTGTILERLFD